MPHALETRLVPAADPAAQALIEAMVAELHVLNPDRQAQRSLPVTAAELTAPEGAFLVVSENGTSIAGGGVKRLDDGLGEVKRMYVVPFARGRGISRLLLAAIEVHAQTLGYVRLRLDTGPAQPAARHLYVTSGYEEIADYNGNPYAAFWGEKRLRPGN